MSIGGRVATVGLAAFLIGWGLAAAWPLAAMLAAYALLVWATYRLGEDIRDLQ